MSGKKNKNRSQNAKLSNSSDEQHIELREEELRAEKERVEAGEVRLRKEIVEETKSIQVPVTREEVVIEKRVERVSETVKREEAWVDRTQDATVRTRNGDWEGQERRSRSNSSYRGPERRVASV